LGAVTELFQSDSQPLGRIPEFVPPAAPGPARDEPASGHDRTGIGRIPLALTRDRATHLPLFIRTEPNAMSGAPVSPILDVSDDVRAEIGDDETNRLLTGENAPGSYDCTSCRTPGDSSQVRTSTVLFVGDETAVLAFAHATCIPSQVVKVSEEQVQGAVRTITADAAGAADTGATGAATTAPAPVAAAPSAAAVPSPPLSRRTPKPQRTSRLPHRSGQFWVSHAVRS
jgi:hypothetical protein